MMVLDDIIRLEKQYYCPVFSRQKVCFTRGEDVHLFDTEGNRYTDFLSGIGVCCLGYSDEGYKDALRGAIDSLMHTSNLFYNEVQSRLAELLCKATGYDNAFFSNSGAEAVEGALKLALKYHYALGKPRRGIITLKGSFHGRTLATLAATGQSRFHEAFRPLPKSFVHVDPKDPGELKDAVNGGTAAVMIEPIIGEGGVSPVSGDFLAAAREACDKHGALLIADEIQCGMGRTGTLLASEASGIKPDVVVLAKALGGGVPIGAFLARGEAARAFSAGDHGSTFGGNQLACTAAYYVVNKLVSTDLMRRVADTGEYFISKLKELKEKSRKIVQVRGRGLMIGAELAPDASAKEIQTSLLALGFVTATAGTNTLRFLPPYIIRREHIDSLIGALETLL